MSGLVFVNQAACQVLSYHSAQAHLHWLAGGVVQVIYFGLLCRPSLQSLRTQAVAATASAGCLLVEMDKALVALEAEPPQVGGVYAANTAPGCLIVADDQLAMWAAHAKDLARIGVMRLVFPRSQAALAADMARELAGARR